MSKPDRSSWRSARFWLIPGVMLAGVAVVIALGYWERQRGAMQFVVYPPEQVAGVDNPHDYNGKPLCQRCHLSNDRRLSVDPVALCLECHSFEHGNHPVEVVQKERGPDFDLPLAPDGKVLCHTCHDQHDVKSQADGLRMEFNQLCVRCHPGH